MNKKRVLAMLLAGAMALSMTACGGGNSASTDDSSNDGGASASGGSYKVSVILKTLAAEYWQYVKSGAEDYASEHSDKVTVEVKGPSSETAFDEMQNMIETDLSSGTYDGIVISPLQSDTAAQLVSGTKLPIVAIDTNFDAPEVVSYVGTGNEAAAKKGAIAAVEAAKKAGWDEVKCIEIAGVQGDETCAARMKGYEEGVNEAGGEFLTSEVQYATRPQTARPPRWRRSCRPIRKASRSSAHTMTTPPWRRPVRQRVMKHSKTPSSSALTVIVLRARPF